MSSQPVLGRLKDIETQIARCLHSGWVYGFSPAEHFFEPSVDVFETADDIFVRMEIPGARRKDIKIFLSGNILVIRGSRRERYRSFGLNYYQMEIGYGMFERHLAIDVPMRRNAMRSVYRDGFLEVRLPKRRPFRRPGATSRRPRRLEIP